jgi:hypothetical protein
MFLQTPTEAGAYPAARLLLIILTANGFLPGGSGTTISHNTQIILEVMVYTY